MEGVISYPYLTKMKRLFNANPVEVPQVIEENARPSDSEGGHVNEFHEKGPRADEKTPGSDSEVLDEKLQYGVQSAKAINQVWTKNQLIAVYIL